MSEPAAATGSLPEYAAPAADLTAAAEVPFFLVGIPKLIVMTFLTFGLYQVYWFYKHWQRLARYGGEDVWPAVRAVFSVVFSFMLFTRITAEGDAQGTPSFFQPFFLLLVYFTANASLRFGMPVWLALAVMLVPLVIAQRIVNGLPAVQALPRARHNTRFTPWNWTWAGSLGLLFALGALLPEPATTSVALAPGTLDSLVAAGRRELPRPLGDGLVLEHVARMPDAIELDVRLTEVALEDVGRRDVLGPVQMSMLRQACASAGLEGHALEQGMPLRYTFVDKHKTRMGIMTLSNRAQCTVLAPDR